MKIICTSDLHGALPIIDECDLLLIAGDILPHFDFAPSLAAQRDWGIEWLQTAFTIWLDNTPAKEIVGIAGNHDWAFQKRSKLKYLPWRYLHSNSIEIEGLKIWGGPYTRTLCGWAFELDREQMCAKWDTIPKDVDIIMVHGPVYGFGDRINRPMYGEDPHTGCQNLLQRIVENQFPNLKLVVTGHIHEGYGMVESHGIKFINPSLMNYEFDPVNLPIEIVLDQSE